MANQTKTEAVSTKPAKAAPTLHEKVKQQLNTAALRGKISVAELQDLQAHINKIAGLLA